jgi:hypothetical protein
LGFEPLISYLAIFSFARAAFWIFLISYRSHRFRHLLIPLWFASWSKRFLSRNSWFSFGFLFCSLSQFVWS